ncbi:MAG: FtsQ-type POTRA domain-containing protein [Cyanobacteria bacterium P01_G01_bin.39]
MSAFPPPQLKHKIALVNLHRQRLERISLGRSSLIICSTLSLFLLSTLSYWQVKKQSQIKINGGKLVNKNTIYRTLSFDYPQFIWTIDGKELEKNIKSIPSVAAAKVNRQIIPPQIVISLQEKSPVALASFQGQVGFLDPQGDWISLNFYSNFNNDLRLPKLKVINYQIEYKSTWKKVYSLISRHPKLEVSQVQWNPSGSIFIQTKIGRFLLGSELSQIEQQFQIMSRLKNLPQHHASREIAYIDVSNPEVILIQRY